MSDKWYVWQALSSTDCGHASIGRPSATVIEGFATLDLAMADMLANPWEDDQHCMVYNIVECEEGDVDHVEYVNGRTVVLGWYEGEGEYPDLMVMKIGEAPKRYRREDDTECCYRAVLVG